MSINKTDVVTELGAYSRKSPDVIKNMVYKTAEALSYMKAITKVDGEYPVVHSITGHIVQGFAAVWNAVGVTKLKANILKAYRQKVNYEFVPADVLNSWVAFMYAEDVKPADMPISKYIIEKELMPRVVADIEYLIGHGAYDAADLATFGKSMDGLIVLLTAGIADGTMYKMPIAAITDSNIVSQVDKFEDGIPDEIDTAINKIYMSKKNKRKYQRDFRNQFGDNNDYSKTQTLKTYSGDRDIIGLSCLNGSDLIFATPDDNFLKLIDINVPPKITDIQTADYKVKVFMEWVLGVGFHINQMVLVSVVNGNGSGLAVDSDLYYAN